jgi:hypothetical protein
MIFQTETAMKDPRDKWRMSVVEYAHWIGECYHQSHLTAYSNHLITSMPWKTTELLNAM